MPITFHCPCGKSLRVADEHAGKRIKCPACQAVGTAPAPKVEPQFEVVEDEAPEPAPVKAKPKPAAKPAPRDEDEDPGFTVEEDEEEKPKPKKKPNFSKGARRDAFADAEEDEDEPRPKPKKRPRRAEEDEDEEDERPRRRRSNPDAGQKIMYVIGGAVLAVVGIAIAVYWWQSGPHTGRRPYSGYILGGCLVFVGIGTVIKGITGNIDEDE